MQKIALIVEDEFLLAMDLACMLEDEGWEVLGPTGSVQAALRLLEQQSPTVAILDVNLRNELVTPLAEALKSCKVPFVIASAVGDPVELCGEVLAEAPVLSKPVDRYRLLLTIEGLLGGPMRPL